MRPNLVVHLNVIWENLIRVLLFFPLFKKQLLARYLIDYLIKQSGLSVGLT